MKLTQFIVALAPAFLAVVKADILPTSELQNIVNFLIAIQVEVESHQGGISSVNDSLSGYDGWANETIAWDVSAIQADFTKAYADIEALIQTLVQL
jgi:hypothetical protein